MNAGLRQKLCPLLIINFNLHLDCQTLSGFYLFDLLDFNIEKNEIYPERSFKLFPSCFPKRTGITLCHVFPQLFVSSEAGPSIRLTITVKTCFPMSACGEFSEAQWLPDLLSLNENTNTPEHAETRVHGSWGGGAMIHIFFPWINHNSKIN